MALAFPRLIIINDSDIDLRGSEPAVIDNKLVFLQGFNLHVNGVFHCTVRYRQFFSLYERIKKEFPTISITLPKFPPKKLLPLSIAQLEERRVLLEKYFQAGKNSFWIEV